MDLLHQADITYWYPHIREHSTPDTSIVDSADVIDRRLTFEDVEACSVALHQVAHRLREEADLIDAGGPVFLRSGYTSAKHRFSDTCALWPQSDVVQHMTEIGVYAMMHMMPALAVRTWAVRRWVDIEHAFTAFQGMPVGVEVRFFVCEGAVTHEQFYWPQNALEGHTQAASWRQRLERMRATPRRGARALAQSVAQTVQSDFPADACDTWSVDACLCTDGAWYVTDMAPGPISYRYDESGATER